MSTDKAKIAIVKKVMSIDDKEALRTIQEFIEMRGYEPWPVMPEEVKRSIDISLAQADRGEFKTHEEVMRKYTSWLKPSSGRKKRKTVSTR